MRFVFVFILTFLPFTAQAQETDSVFRDYSSYAEFVDTRVMTRQFIELIQVLGGRDEYTESELRGVNNRFLSIYRGDFTDGTATKIIDLGNGFRQEMRVYWRNKGSYVFFYAFLHQRENDLVVLNFTLNSDVTKILREF